MSETVNSTPDALEAIVSEYETGVAEHETNDPKTWLAVRDQIETHYDELTEEQASRVEDADSDLVEHAGEVAARLAATPGESLRDLRKGTARPPEQWWWYLDVLSHVSDHYESGGKTEGSTASRLLTIVELVVLAVAIVLLAIRFLPQLQGSATPTAFPTFTPAPTSTPDPSAFDLTTATTFKAPNDVVEILLPKSWKNNDLSNPAMYSFVLGDPQNPTVEIRVWIDTLANLFGGQSGATAPTTPQDALKSISDNFKQSAPSTSGAKFSEV
ncbi:MAG TPA: hypothetical protein VKQ72_12340, partial [Aggregatilineales bacterium]|nr:hypothetical protein [Aggregatilineales bacterium]